MGSRIVGQFGRQVCGRVGGPMGKRMDGQSYGLIGGQTSWRAGGWAVRPTI